MERRGFNRLFIAERRMAPSIADKRIFPQRSSQTSFDGGPLSVLRLTESSCGRAQRTRSCCLGITRKELTA
jgi:hypothetical protein